MIKKWGYSLFIVAMIIVMTLIVSFANRKFGQSKCQGVSVLIPENSPHFLTEAEISAMINKAAPHLYEKTMAEINTNQLEVMLEKVDAIKNAEVYRHVSGSGLNLEGELVIEINQRQPIMRVYSGSDDYYMDEEGVTIPANSNYSAHVLLITGDVDKSCAEKLLPMIRYIDKSPFWKAQIGQINVNKKNELTIVPLVGDQLIEFGTTDNYRIKFRNLLAFYQQGMPKFGWRRYQKISVKFRNQVVCTKK